MLYPQSNPSRLVMDLSGIWDFRLKEDSPWESIAVPASYNDQNPDPKYRKKIILNLRGVIIMFWKSHQSAAASGA